MITTKDILIRLGLAAIFGALIGLERERKNWTAGMRTHMMVCLGSSLIMIVSAFGFSDILGTEHVVLDPARIAAQVISGIGFIGAGTILFLKQGVIRGLTTAAGLWTVAAIGLATGGGMYFAAAVATVLSLLILWGLQPFERKISQKFRQKTLIAALGADAEINTVLQKIQSLPPAMIDALSIAQETEGPVIQITFARSPDEDIHRFIGDLQKETSIRQLTWNK